MRKNIIAGNWKSNKTISQAIVLAEEVKALAAQIQTEAEIILGAPSLYLIPLKKVLGADSKVKLSAQNASAYRQGAYTGEISADQLAAADIPYVILGHSERRTLFGDTDEVIQTKVKQALTAGIRPIFCCGEPLEIRQADTQNELVKTQVETALFSLTDAELRNVVIAYEPVWAIGTGLTASAQQAQDMHAFIRSLLADKYGKSTADEISILYGGSVKSSNAAEIFGMADVDGGLIGGASLVAEEFINIVKCA